MKNYMYWSRQAQILVNELSIVFKNHGGFETHLKPLMPFSENITIHMYQDKSQNYKEIKVNRKVKKNCKKYIGNQGEIIEYSNDLLVPWIRNISRRSGIEN